MEELDQLENDLQLIDTDQFGARDKKEEMEKDC